MQRFKHSGWLYFLVWFLLLDLVSRTVVAGHAYTADYLEMNKLNRALAAWSRQPAIVFLGASHTQCGVAAVDVAESLGLPAGAVVNTGFGAAGPREMLYLYRANRDLLGSAALVVINVDGWMFNRNIHLVERNGPPSWRCQAGLADRLTAPAPPGTKADWLLGWLSGTWDQRDTWTTLLRTRWLAYRAGPAVPAIYDRLGRPLLVAAQENRPMTPGLLEQDASVAAARHLGNYSLSSDALDDLATLTDLAIADGARVCFISFPLSPAYLNQIQVEYPQADNLWREELSRRFPAIDWLDFTGLELPVTDFRDADHLSTAGAVHFALRLTPALQPLLP